MGESSRPFRSYQLPSALGLAPVLRAATSLPLYTHTLNHHKIKHLQTPQALKPRSGELVIAADEIPQAATCPHSRSFVRKQ
jgi:hypothetical protein